MMTPKFELIKQEDRLYHVSSALIGLTGGIATGKSQVAAHLRKKGFIVLDADALVKEIYLEEETIAFIQNKFPESISNGEIDFPELRKVFFNNSDAKKEIESFIYKRLPFVFMDKLHANKDVNVVFYDVPLLFEKDLHLKTDLNVVVYASREQQVKRLLARDSINVELANKILDAQWDIEKKKEKADVVIDNTGDLKDIENIVESFIQANFIV